MSLWEEKAWGEGGGRELKLKGREMEVGKDGVKDRGGEIGGDK